MTDKKRIRSLVIGALIFFCFTAFRYNHVLKEYYAVPSKDSQTAYLGTPTLSEKQLLKLGWLDDSKRKMSIVNFLNYPVLKSPDTIRIGIFGGSRLLCGGTNNGASYDYAALLQDRFRKAGINNVKILNFGVNGYGFFQEYMLWELLGKKYGLDYVILTLNEIPWVRDQGFASEGWNHYLHARYIVKNNKLILIPVSGNTRYEAIRIHCRIFPPLRYILYDVRIPMFLRVFLPNSLRNRKNPFYYRRFVTLEKELIPIYSSILNDISGRVKNLIVLTKPNMIGEFQRRVKSSNVYFYQPQTGKYMKLFILHEPMNVYKNRHPNRLGNKIVADELFSLLTGDVGPRVDCIKLFYDSSCNSDGLYDAGHPISYYNDVYVKCGNYPIAYFTTFSGKLFFRKIDTGESDQSMDIWSLLMFPRMTEEENPVFIPMVCPLKNKESVFLSFEKDNKIKKIPIGMLDSSTGVLGRILLNSETIIFDYNTSTPDIKLVINNQALLSSMRGVDNFCIMVGDKKVLSADECFISKILSRIMYNFCGKITSIKLTLKPVVSEYAYLSSDYRYFFDDDVLAANENKLDLVLSNGGQEVRYPVFLCKFVQANTVPFDKIYNPRIANPGDKESF